MIPFYNHQNSNVSVEEPVDIRIAQTITGDQDIPLVDTESHPNESSSVESEQPDHESGRVNAVCLVQSDCTGS